MIILEIYDYGIGESPPSCPVCGAEVDEPARWLWIENATAATGGILYCADCDRSWLAVIEKDDRQTYELKREAGA